jgi:hypothetical protein
MQVKQVKIGYDIEYAMTYIWTATDEENAPSVTLSRIAQTSAQADEIVKEFYPGATWIRKEEYEYPVEVTPWM